MKIAILGASRGLGAALVQTIQNDEKPSRLFLSSRQLADLQALARAEDVAFSADFTKPEEQKQLLIQLREFSPHMIFYVAGGGPFGSYDEKNWRDHHWALELNLNFPAMMIHELLKNKKEFTDLKKIVVVGSAIAGNNPDPRAASYAAAKHGLRGLITSLQKENHSIELALFEPGYMDTSMLPPHAWPRQQGLAKDPREEARKLWQWSQT